MYKFPFSLLLCVGTHWHPPHIHDIFFNLYIQNNTSIFGSFFMTRYLLLFESFSFRFQPKAVHIHFQQLKKNNTENREWQENKKMREN